MATSNLNKMIKYKKKRSPSLPLSSEKLKDNFILSVSCNNEKKSKVT